MSRSNKALTSKEAIEEYRSNFSRLVEFNASVNRSKVFNRVFDKVQKQESSSSKKTPDTYHVVTKEIDVLQEHLRKVYTGVIGELIVEESETHCWNEYWRKREKRK